MQQPSDAEFFFRLVQPYRHIAALVVLLSLLGSAFDGASIGLLIPLLHNLQQTDAGQHVPRIFQWLLELLRPYTVERQVVLTIGFVLVAILLKNVFLALSVGLGHWLSAQLLVDVRTRIMRVLMGAGVQFHRRSQLADLLDNAMADTQHLEHLAKIAVEFVSNGLTLLILIAMLFLLSWQLTLITLGVGAVFAFGIANYTKSVRRLGEQSARLERALFTSVHESLGGIELIKSYSKEEEHLRSLSAQIAASGRMIARRNFWPFTVHPLTDVLGATAIALLFVSATFLYAMETRLILTQLLPFLYILLRIVPLTKILNMQRADLAVGGAYVERVRALLREDDKPRVVDGQAIFPGLTHNIQFRGVTFRYPDAEKPVLREVTFTLAAGHTTAIVGESGAGKSTLVSLLLRFDDPQHGEIVIDGEPLTRFQLASYHCKVALVSQDTFLFNNTVKHNITFSAITPPTDEQIIAAAQKAGAHEFIMALPDGYDTFVGDRGVKLSGGQRQRLSIARAIVRDPDILILDEATSALDMPTEQRIQQAILELTRGRTVIVIAHRRSTIQQVDRVIVLKDGQVHESGSPAQLSLQGGEYAYGAAEANAAKR